jgi:hypothetical protein
VSARLVRGRSKALDFERKLCTVFDPLLGPHFRRSLLVWQRF